MTNRNTDKNTDKNTDRKKFLDIARQIGGIVVEYKDRYKHFKTDEDMIAWAKRIYVFSLKPYGPPIKGKQRVIPYFDEVNFIACFDKN